MKNQLILSKKRRNSSWINKISINIQVNINNGNYINRKNDNNINITNMSNTNNINNTTTTNDTNINNDNKKNILMLRAPILQLL